MVIRPGTLLGGVWSYSPPFRHPGTSIPTVIPAKAGIYGCWIH